MFPFTATIERIGINPFVFVPEEILAALFEQAGKNKSPIPIHGTVNGVVYQQNLMFFKGEWRLYINTSMLKDSPQRIGENIQMTVAYDPSERTIAPHPKLTTALHENPEAFAVFNALIPSRQKEIVRYIAALKTEESIDNNVKKAIAFLLGHGRFIGRDGP
ncbi:YdeI/OmpD-associated family protein [Flavobacterium sp. GCM10027622]|uniref:YdeI/OmpD-associated family protein n=1 Tax=unclassified Flavobacterium TaxID=196869 RepID=UPI00361206AE